jgi:hypothetical protein
MRLRKQEEILHSFVEEKFCVLNEFSCVSILLLILCWNYSYIPIGRVIAQAVCCRLPRFDPGLVHVGFVVVVQGVSFFQGISASPGTILIPPTAPHLLIILNQQLKKI